MQSNLFFFRINISGDNESKEKIYIFNPISNGGKSNGGKGNGGKGVGGYDHGGKGGYDNGGKGNGGYDNGGKGNGGHDIGGPGIKVVVNPKFNYESMY